MASGRVLRNARRALFPREHNARILVQKDGRGLSDTAGSATLGFGRSEPALLAERILVERLKAAFGDSDDACERGIILIKRDVPELNFNEDEVMPMKENTKSFGFVSR